MTETAPYARMLDPLEDVPDAPSALAERLGSGAAAPAPQRAFPWSPDGWARRLSAVPGIESFLTELAEAPLDRGAVVRHVAQTTVEGRTDLAFVAAMIWGYGSSGYGPYRTHRVLSGGGADGTGPDERVLAQLCAASTVAREHGALAGFYALNNAPGKVRHLGPAFFTKWLYFTTAVEGPDDVAAAPILDMRVRQWIAGNTGVRLDLWRTRDYARYLQLLDAWGVRPEGTLSRVAVERSIFALS